MTKPIINNKQRRKQTNIRSLIKMFIKICDLLSRRILNKIHGGEKISSMDIKTNDDKVDRIIQAKVKQIRKQIRKRILTNTLKTFELNMIHGGENSSLDIKKT